MARSSLFFRIALASIFANIIVSLLFFSLCLYRLRPDQPRLSDQLDYGYQPKLVAPRHFSPVASYNASGRRLTDVVVPLVKAQLPRLRANLELWRTFPPCVLNPANASGDYLRHHPDVGRNVGLTFALSDAPDKQFRREILRHFARLPEGVRGCFDRVQVYFADLKDKDNDYMRGSRNMFYYLLNNTIGLHDPHYVLYMEPDLYPIRKHWLAALDASVREPVAPFWLRGSLYRGSIRKVLCGPLHIVLHINGNAIYNLADPAFRHYVFDMMHAAGYRGITKNAYDTDIFRYLVKNYGIASTIAHKFHYTDMIQNYWHSKWSAREINAASPLAYLVHGGLNIDEL